MECENRNEKIFVVNAFILGVLNNTTYVMWFNLVFSVIFYCMDYFMGLNEQNIKNERNILNEIFISILFSLILTIFANLTNRNKSIFNLSMFVLLLSILNIDNCFNYTLKKLTISTLSYADTIFMYVSLSCLIIILFSIFVSYMQTTNYFETDLSNFPIDLFIEEIKLRTDILKINFNAMMVNTNIHKYFPGLLYKKNDYYFMNESEISKFKKPKDDRLVNSMSTTVDTEYEYLK